jgi:hypothetical protein
MSLGARPFPEFRGRLTRIVADGMPGPFHLCFLPKTDSMLPPNPGHVPYRERCLARISSSNESLDLSMRSVENPDCPSNWDSLPMPLHSAVSHRRTPITKPHPPHHPSDFHGPNTMSLLVPPAQIQPNDGLWAIICPHSPPICQWGIRQPPFCATWIVCAIAGNGSSCINPGLSPETGIRHSITTRHSLLNYRVGKAHPASHLMQFTTYIPVHFLGKCLCVIARK